MAALPSLLGMAVDYRPGWDGHDARRKCGIITEADVEGNELRVSGYLFGRDFPEVEEQLNRGREGTMGMSYELADAHVEDMRAEVWTTDPGDIHRRGDSAAREGGVSRHIVSLDAGRCQAYARPMPSSAAEPAQAAATYGQVIPRAIDWQLQREREGNRWKEAIRKHRTRRARA